MLSSFIIPPQSKFVRGYIGVSLLVWSVGLSVKNLVTWTSFTFLEGFGSNFACALYIKCRCAWYKFRMSCLIDYRVIAPDSTENLKILWRELLSHFFTDLVQILHVHCISSVDVGDINFAWVVWWTTELLPLIQLKI